MDCCRTNCLTFYQNRYFLTSVWIELWFHLILKINDINKLLHIWMLLITEKNAIHQTQSTLLLYELNWWNDGWTRTIMSLVMFHPQQFFVIPKLGTAHTWHTLRCGLQFGRISCIFVDLIKWLSSTTFPTRFSDKWIYRISGGSHSEKKDAWPFLACRTMVIINDNADKNIHRIDWVRACGGSDDTWQRLCSRGNGFVMDFRLAPCRRCCCF